MAGDETTGPGALTDRGRVTQLVFGSMAAQTLRAAVELGVVERIGDGERRSRRLSPTPERDGLPDGTATRGARCSTRSRVNGQEPGVDRSSLGMAPPNLRSREAYSTHASHRLRRSKSGHRTSW